MYISMFIAHNIVCLFLYTHIDRSSLPPSLPHSYVHMSVCLSVINVGNTKTREIG